jgi:hypothetical protein
MSVFAGSAFAQMGQVVPQQVELLRALLVLFPELLVLLLQLQKRHPWVNHTKRDRAAQQKTYLSQFVGDPLLDFGGLGLYLLGILQPQQSLEILMSNDAV